MSDKNYTGHNSFYFKFTRLGHKTKTCLIKINDVMKRIEIEAKLFFKQLSDG